MGEGDDAEGRGRQAQIVVALEPPNADQDDRLKGPGPDERWTRQLERQRVRNRERPGDQQREPDIAPARQPASNESGDQNTRQSESGRIGESEWPRSGPALGRPVEERVLVDGQVRDRQRSEDRGRAAGIDVAPVAVDRRQNRAFDRPANRHRRTVELALDGEGHCRDPDGVDEDPKRIRVAPAPDEIRAECEVSQRERSDVRPLPRGEVTGEHAQPATEGECGVEEEEGRRTCRLFFQPCLLRRPQFVGRRGHRVEQPVGGQRRDGGRYVRLGGEPEDELRRRDRERDRRQPPPGLGQRDRRRAHDRHGKECDRDRVGPGSHDRGRGGNRQQPEDGHGLRIHSDGDRRGHDRGHERAGEGHLRREERVVARSRE